MEKKHLLRLIGLGLFLSFFFSPLISVLNPSLPIDTTPQKYVSNPPQIEGYAGYAIYYINDFINLTWIDGVPDDIDVTEESGTENQFWFEGIDGYGTVANHKVHANIKINTWLKIELNTVYFSGAGHFHLQMHLGGTWRYNLVTITSAGDYYLNMSAYTGMAGEWQIFVMEDATADDYLVIDKFILYQNYTIPEWNNAQEVEFEIETPPTPVWHNSQEVYFDIMVEMFQGSIFFFISFAGLIMIPLSTLYLARCKQQNKLDLDTFMLFLMFFAMGWSLFIGGIVAT